ncbi:hypothetical protein OSB04_031968 [Centaurea solstitialis]|uniref:CCHC-type domain-containing protein n=1 Tax=Centaurea solstitialis TaxID=347529 RepID=A0AA38SAK6_9ASTR|nr:hypothetical protein OSB04_031968 [Centaurea solstitialis]
MANTVNASFMSTGSQSKPLTLFRDEYPQWNVRMINFLEGIHPRICEFLYNPPYIPMDLIPRVPATGTTPEIPEHYEPKAREIEGGKKILKNNRAFCIDKYHNFKAKEGEVLSDTYSRFNTLISNCKRYGVVRTTEENNSLFLKSLGGEWTHLMMSMKAALDLMVWTLGDLFGSLKSQEPQVLQMKISYGGPLALMAGDSFEKKAEPKKEVKEKKKNKKVLIAESDGSSEKSKRDESDRREEGQKTAQRGEELRKDEVKEGCFKCGNLGHFTVECWSKGQRVPQKGPREATFYKEKAYNYQQKSLLAQISELVTDESSEEEAQKGRLDLEGDSDTEGEIFCGMAKIDNDSSDSNVYEVSTSYSSKSMVLYNEIIDNLDSCHLDNEELKEKLSFYEKEITLLVDPALLRPDEMIMILNLYLVNRFQDQDQETNESVLQSTDPVH